MAFVTSKGRAVLQLIGSELGDKEPEPQSAVIVLKAAEEEPFQGDVQHCMSRCLQQVLHVWPSRLFHLHRPISEESIARATALAQAVQLLQSQASEQLLAIRCEEFMAGNAF